MKQPDCVRYVKKLYIRPLILTTGFLVVVLFLLSSQESFSEKKVLGIQSERLVALSHHEDFPIHLFAYPRKAGTTSFELAARAGVVLDLESGAILFEKNKDIQLSPASLTKIATALTAFDRLDLNKVITIGPVYADGSQMGLMPGEKITVSNLLYGMLIQSGNDAAWALFSALSSNADERIRMLNETAESLFAQNTHFSGPTGMEIENHYSSAQDLALLAQMLVRKPLLAQIVATKEVEVSSYDKTRFHYVRNQNKLLWDYPGTLGIKTGYTEKAGECLIALVENNGHRVISVILGSNDRSTETQRLLDWVFSVYEW